MVSALAINTDKLVLVAFALLWFALFFLSRIFRWDEITYEQFKHSRTMWFWLDTFGVPKTRENCLRFMLAAWIGGLLLVLLCTIAAVRSRG
jgi:hypothetical protein